MFESNTLFQVAVGAAMIGAVCGMTGTALLFKKALSLAPAVSFAGLPGLIIPFLLVSAVSQRALLFGAGTFGILAAVQLTFFVSRKNIDILTVIIITLSFAFGMTLLSSAQHLPGAAQIDLQRFLVGDASVIITNDNYLLGYIVLAVFSVFILFWKEIITVSFDREFARISGMPVKFFDALIAVLLVISVLIGLEAVGIIFIGALITIPAIAARQWTNDTGAMFILAIGFGTISGCAGSVVAALLPGLPTGAAVTLFAAFFALSSFFIAPSRGTLWRKFRKKTLMHSPDNAKVLEVLRSLSAQHGTGGHGHSAALINALFGDRDTESILLELKVKGLAVDTAADMWSITRDGREYLEMLPNIPSKKSSRLRK
jgi:manganese/zinc/iron transport system permease protein